MKHLAVCTECDWMGDPKLLNAAARDAGEHRDETGHAAQVERAAATDGGVDQGDGEVDHRFDECPTCGGELQYQTEADAECLNCGEVFCHEVRTDRHLLWDYDDLGWMRGVVARA